MLITASTASFIVGNDALAAITCSGIPYTFKVNSVKHPSVPSEPTKIPFK